MIINTITSNKNLRVVRDDLYPFLGGGNKGRKMDHISDDIFARDANALVTTGGIQSNHCRATAVFAAQHGIRCSLILHGSKELFDRQGGNAKIMRESGAQCIFVEDPKDISSAMDRAMDAYKKDSLRPYYLYGGGHTLEGGLAYINAIEDLQAYCHKQSWNPDYIFLASGTGSTQAGILSGLSKFNLNAKVIGISVGRQKQQAENVVGRFYEQLCSNFSIIPHENVVHVMDEFLCGGYGQYNTPIEQLSRLSLKTYGFTLDTTYTAKAFYGMQQYIQQHQLDSKNILFWHTGGVFNYLAE